MILIKISISNIHRKISPYNDITKLFQIFFGHYRHEEVLKEIDDHIRTCKNE